MATPPDASTFGSSSGPTEVAAPEQRPPGASLPIGAVERDTGIGKDTLRVWERRYGFPSPTRDAFGERVYPMEQVQTLRIVRRLLDIGHRPGRVLRMSPEQIRALAENGPKSPSTRNRFAWQDLDKLMALIASHDTTTLRLELSALLARVGPRRFVLEVVAPMNVAVGDAWVRGQMEVFEEHAFTEQVQAVMRQAIAAMPPPDGSGRPIVLLSTLPGEPHGLGLLMVEVMFRLEGCHCVSLGPQTPTVDLARAATVHGADIVGLSATGIQGTRSLLSGLAELRGMLSADIEIWAGGAAIGLRRARLPGVTPVAALESIPSNIDRWRRAHGMHVDIRSPLRSARLIRPA